QRGPQFYRLPRRARAQLDAQRLELHRDAPRTGLPRPAKPSQPSTIAHSTPPTANFTGPGIEPIDDQNASTKAANSNIANTPMHSLPPTLPPSPSASIRRRRPGATRPSPSRSPAVPATTIADNSGAE